MTIISGRGPALPDMLSSCVARRRMLFTATSGFVRIASTAPLEPPSMAPAKASETHQGRERGTTASHLMDLMMTSISKAALQPQQAQWLLRRTIAEAARRICRRAHESGGSHASVLSQRVAFWCALRNKMTKTCKWAKPQ